MVCCGNTGNINLDHIAGLEHLAGYLLASEQRYFVSVEVYGSVACSRLCLEYGNSYRLVLKTAPLSNELFTLYLLKTLLNDLLCRLCGNSAEMLCIQLYRYNIAVFQLSAGVGLCLLHRDLVCIILDLCGNFLLDSHIELALCNINIKLDILASGIFLLDSDNKCCLYLLYQHSGVNPLLLCKQCQSLKKLRCVAVSHF